MIWGSFWKCQPLPLDGALTYLWRCLNPLHIIKYSSIGIQARIVIPNPLSAILLMVAKNVCNTHKLYCVVQAMLLVEITIGSCSNTFVEHLLYHPLVKSLNPAVIARTERKLQWVEGYLSVIHINKGAGWVSSRHWHWSQFCPFFSVKDEAFA